MTQEDHDTLIRIETTVNNLEKLISGNGQPGLLQRVGKLENFKGKLIGALTVIATAVSVFGATLIKHLWGTK